MALLYIARQCLCDCLFHQFLIIQKFSKRLVGKITLIHLTFNEDLHAPWVRIYQVVPGTTLKPRFSLERMSSALVRPKLRAINSFAHAIWAYQRGIAAFTGFVLIAALMHNA
jgi:hypothetical protein